MKSYILHNGNESVFYKSKEDATTGQGIFGGVIVEKENHIFRFKGELFYVDKNGDRVLEGDHLEFDDGRVMKVYLTEDGHLGTDATDPSLVESGEAIECEFGIYPLIEAELRNAQLYVKDK